MEGRIQYKREIETTRDWEKKDIPRYPPLLADENKGGQSN
jgi:hypothetical protein